MNKTPNLQNAKTPSKEKIYNLEERLTSFVERVYHLCNKIPLNARTNRPISQLIGSSGSTAANYCEASEAMSKKDFIKCIKIARKEAKECRIWLRGLIIVAMIDDPEFDALIQESMEFIYIFTAILKKTDVK